MADYICKHCKYNNHGWCVAKKKNGLGDTIECNQFKNGKYGEFKNVKEAKPLDAVALEADIQKEIDFARGVNSQMAMGMLQLLTILQKHGLCESIN